MAVHMLNWAVRSVKFLGVEFDQSKDKEVAIPGHHAFVSERF